MIDQELINAGNKSIRVAELLERAMSPEDQADPTRLRQTLDAARFEAGWTRNYIAFALEALAATEARKGAGRRKGGSATERGR